MDRVVTLEERRDRRECFILLSALGTMFDRFAADAEAYAYHEKTYQESQMKFGTSVRRRMLEGAFLGAADYITAQRARAVLNEKIRANFTRVDVFAVPSAARPPEAFTTMDPNEQNLRPKTSPTRST